MKKVMAEPSSKNKYGSSDSFFFMMLGIIFGTVNPNHAATCENPETLTFATYLTEETIAELNCNKPDRPSGTTYRKKIAFFMPTSYASVVEGLLSKHVDIAVPWWELRVQPHHCQ